MARSAAVAAVHAAVREALSDLQPRDVVLVACSGGADSLALAAVSAELAGRRGWRAGAVVVDHGWSAAGGAAGRQAARACRELGLDPVERVRVDCSGPGGPEAAARTARYAALQAAAERHGARAVLLGHTLDDQAETVLLGLARGSGARSLAGMPARRGVFRRPLLGLPRASTQATCQHLGLQPWADPANDDPAYARARLRRMAADLEAALGPGVVRALARSADQLRDDADALEQLAAELHALADPRLRGELLTEPLLAAPAAIRRRCLLAAARCAGSPAGGLGHRHVLALEGLLTGRESRTADLPGSVQARAVTGPDGERRLVLGRCRAPAPGVGNSSAPPKEQAPPTPSHPGAP